MAFRHSIADGDVARIQGVLERLMADAGCAAVLLIARGGETLAAAGAPQALDTTAVAALAASGFGSTAPMAQLLGEREFSAVIHEGARQSLHVSAVDEATILIAVFDERTTVGMVRVFAREAARKLSAILDEARGPGRSSGGRHGRSARHGT
ncbi:MAG TPA: roadblock/LC7 domain-containing protein [Methylomirabilota bacterium]|jgi:predicted regulator of Ras-like GTPase activity (Roadblock/LC7/MglB family)